MFDISFTELMIIGMIALVVIGPERLPKVARTLGHLLGRAQRYVNDVKTDIKREMDAGDLNNLKNQFDEAKSSVQASLDDASKTIANPMLEAQKAVENAGKSLQASMVDFENEGAATGKETPAEAVTTTSEPAAPSSTRTPGTSP
ncbi:MAG: Sec-independent protein translocase protein TatB [Pusillimonas sp.]